MLPLFIAYEWSVASGSPWRNAAERLASLPLGPLGGWARPARWLLLAAAAVAGFAAARRRGWPLGRAVLRVPLEGALAAVVLGPALLAAMALSGQDPGALGLGSAPAGSFPDLARTAYFFGGAAWEELVFRVGAFSLAFLLLHRSIQALGLGPAPARWIAEGVSLVGSALLFASFHLADATRFLGVGGEAFDAALFAWRSAAGLLLGVLFRLRGPGVAAWAHGLYNAALLLGGGPAVFLS
jgi:hypothetical protein